MKHKLIFSLFGFSIGVALFYTPPQLKFLPFAQSERLLAWVICIAVASGWTTLLTKNAQRGMYASLLFSVMSCIGYQVVVSAYRYRAGMTFHLVSWGRFIPALCMSVLAAVIIGFALGKATLKLSRA